MKEKITKLINVKSIVTLLLTSAFMVLSLTDRIGSNEFMTIFTTIIAFYFGTQTAKGGASNDFIKITSKIC